MRCSSSSWRLESCGSDSNFGDQIQHVVCPDADVFVNRLARIEREILRQITDDQIARRVTSPMSGACTSASSFKSGLATAIAPTKPMRSPSSIASVRQQDGARAVADGKRRWPLMMVSWTCQFKPAEGHKSFSQERGR